MKLSKTFAFFVVLLFTFIMGFIFGLRFMSGMYMDCAKSPNYIKVTSPSDIDIMANGYTVGTIHITPTSRKVRIDD